MKANELSFKLSDCQLLRWYHAPWMYPCIYGHAPWTGYFAQHFQLLVNYAHIFCFPHGTCDFTISAVGEKFEQ
jgi:hypothetical protein